MAKVPSSSGRLGTRAEAGQVDSPAMQAATYDRYGPPDVIRVTDLPVPEPGASELLVRVKAVAVTSGDARIRAARFPRGFALPARLVFGLRRPRRQVLGGTFSGAVESAGSKSGDFAPGDEVCGMTGIRMGAHSEYVAVSAPKVTRKPAGVSHADAAGILFGGTAALYFLREQCEIGQGSKVLINGASGSIGTAAVQLAKDRGATVTAVCSARNFELVERLGADRTVDYHETPVAELAERFDVVLDTVGNIDRRSGTRLLTSDGVLLLTVASLGETVRPGGRVRSGTSPEKPADFDYLLDLVEAGRLNPVVEALDGLESIPEAYERIDSGRKTGNLVIRLD
jgi:NADPH:quinone reductase-like Zn-dependent oxidoreductase